MENLAQELTDCVSDPSPSPMDELENQRLGQAINGFLSTLTSQKRIMFVQRYFFARQISDIARILELSESNVKVTLHRIREDLRHFLEKEDLL